MYVSHVCFSVAATEGFAADRSLVSPRSVWMAKSSQCPSSGPNGGSVHRSFHCPSAL